MINIIMGNKEIDPNINLVNYGFENDNFIINSSNNIAGLELNVNNLNIEEIYLDNDWQMASGNNKILIYNLVGKSLPNGKVFRINNQGIVNSGVAVDWSGKSVELVEGNLFSDTFQLIGAYPNPFNPETSISYILKNNGNVKIDVFDISGQEVLSLYNGIQNVGMHSIQFNGANLSSGIYFIKSQYESSSSKINQSLKINLLK